MIPYAYAIQSGQIAANARYASALLELTETGVCTQAEKTTVFRNGSWKATFAENRDIVLHIPHSPDMKTVTYQKLDAIAVDRHDDARIDAIDCARAIDRMFRHIRKARATGKPVSRHVVGHVGGTPAEAARIEGAIAIMKALCVTAGHMDCTIDLKLPTGRDPARISAVSTDKFEIGPGAECESAMLTGLSPSCAVAFTNGRPHEKVVFSPATMEIEFTTNPIETLRTLRDCPISQDMLVSEVEPIW